MKIENIAITSNEKLGIISNLSTMLAAGIPILDAIESLIEESRGNQKKLLETVKGDIIEGKRLYSSLARFPRSFNLVTVNLIRGAEEAGTLEQTLKDLKKNILEEAEFSDKVKSAATYPIIISIVFFAVLLLVLVVVIPKISVVFQRLNIETPLPTKILIFISDILVGYPIPSLLGFLGFIAMSTLFYKKQKRMVLDFIFMLPVVSKLILKIDLTRFTRSLSLLLSAGIPITTALELVEDVVLKKDLSMVIRQAHENVLAGRNLSEGFKQKRNIIPSIMIRITEAGEKSGSLDRALQDISEYLDYEVSKELKTVNALLEPILLVVVGGMVGGMMFSIIAPIYELISQVGSR